MGIKQKSRSRRQRKRIQNHKRSIIAISGVIVLLILILSVNGVTLRAKETSYQAQEAELTALIEEEEQRSSEIDNLEEYVGTDAYVEEVAKEKLGLVYENELIVREK